MSLIPGTLHPPPTNQAEDGTEDPTVTGLSFLDPEQHRKPCIRVRSMGGAATSRIQILSAWPGVRRSSMLLPQRSADMCSCCPSCCPKNSGHPGYQVPPRTPRGDFLQHTTESTQGSGMCSPLRAPTDQHSPAHSGTAEHAARWAHVSLFGLYS